MTIKWGDRAAQIQSQRWGEPFATTALLTALPAEHRVDKMVCVAAGSFYQFDSSATAAGAGTLAPDTGTGAWIKLGGSASDFKDSVRVASTANLVGTRTANVLLADANGAIAAMDGVTLVVGDRILMKDQTTQADRGIYVITALGGASAKWSMTRAADADTSAKVTSGMLVPVTEGTVGGDKIWQLTTNDAITLNTTSLTFAISGPGLATASPEAIGTAAVGTSNLAARSDHVHAHGNQTGGLHAGTLHDAASTTVAGFMAAADKVFVDRVHEDFGTAIADDGVAINVAQGTTRKLAAGTLSANRSQAVTVPAAGVELVIERLDVSDYTYTLTDAGPGTPTLFVFPGGSVGFVKLRSDGTNVFLKESGIKHAAASATIPGTMTAAHYAFLAGGVKGFCVKGVAPTNVADLGAFVIAGFDGVTYAEGDLVLLAHQTTDTQNGVYQVGAVAGTAPLTRVNWMPTGAVLSGGFTVHVNTGTLFANTNWFISTAGDVTIGTTAHDWYPESVVQSLAIPAGTGTLTITNVPILSATKTMFNFTNVAEVTADLTVRYGLNGAATAGPVGTATAAMIAEIAAGTVNVDDDSTMLVQIVNR